MATGYRTWLSAASATNGKRATCPTSEEPCMVLDSAGVGGDTCGVWSLVQANSLLNSVSWVLCSGGGVGWG